MVGGIVWGSGPDCFLGDFVGSLGCFRVGAVVLDPVLNLGDCDCYQPSPSGLQPVAMSGWDPPRKQRDLARVVWSSFLQVTVSPLSQEQRKNNNF